MHLTTLLQLSEFARADNSLIPAHIDHGIPDELRKERTELYKLTLQLSRGDEQIAGLAEDIVRIDEALEIYERRW